LHLTGITDEAAEPIEGQIEATKELGWTGIELRAVDGKPVSQLTDREFGAVADKIQESGLSVSCLASTIANWGTSVLDPFDTSLEKTRRLIPRMKRLGVERIRIMSYAVLEGRGPEDQEEEERFRRLHALVSLFHDAGITALHENCRNYGGMGWTYTLRLLEKVPHLKLLFDTGNPIGTPDRSGSLPYAMQDSWEFYLKVREHVSYVHVKDGHWDSAKRSVVCCYPGEGEGNVRRIVKDLLQRRFKGWVSVEPHMAAVFHDASVKSSDEQRYSTFTEYGRRIRRMLEELQSPTERSEELLDAR
jgi:sugar phosphate isomerase/epimerase